MATKAAILGTLGAPQVTTVIAARSGGFLKLFFFLAIPNVIYLGSKALHIIGVWDSKIIGTMHCDQLVIWSSVHLLLHQVDFICLVRPRLAEGETWLDSSRWGIAMQL